MSASTVRFGTECLSRRRPKREPLRSARVRVTIMRLRLAGPTTALALGALASSMAAAQGRILDEGTLTVTRAGAVQTENFRIMRVENGLIKAIATVVSGTQKVTSILTVDSVGTPVTYEVNVTEKGAKSVGLKAVAGGSRLVAKTNDQHGDESMREYPIVAGQSLLVEGGLLHQMYFAALGRKPGSIQVIDPRGGRVTSSTLSARGLEPVDVGGKSVTGTHYSLVSGGVRREFWVDSAGRLLRVEIPSEQLVAAREELPR